MTTADMFLTWDTLADESLKGYWRDWEKVIFLNQVKSDWLDQATPGFEKNETLRRRLIRLIREHPFTGAREVVLSGVGRIIRVLKVRAFWPQKPSKEDDGYREVVPEKRDSATNHDPYHRASDLFAVYREYGDVTQEYIIIRSMTIPSQVKIEVLHWTPDFDENKGDQQWNDYFPETVQRDLIQQALVLAAIPDNDVVRLQTAGAAGGQR